MHHMVQELATALGHDHSTNEQKHHYMSQQIYDSSKDGFVGQIQETGHQLRKGYYRPYVKVQQRKGQ